MLSLRLAALAGLVAVPFAAPAAPVPKPSPKEVLAKYWGQTDGHGEFEVEGKQLTIRSFVPPDRGLISLLGKQATTTPRAERTVRGDFTVTVKVLDAALPNKDSKHDSSWPNTRAGLFVSGGGYGVEFHLYQYFTKVNNVVKDAPTRCVWVDTWYPRGGSGSQLRQAEAGKSTWLRLTRKDNVVSVSSSFDGETWSNAFTPRKDLDFPDEVTVGTFFGHSTYQTLSATFEGFTVEQPKEKK